MVAEPGVTYAQIVGGKIHWLFTSAEMPEWADVKDEPAPVMGINVVTAPVGAVVGNPYP